MYEESYPEAATGVDTFINSSHTCAGAAIDSNFNYAPLSRSIIAAVFSMSDPAKKPKLFVAPNPTPGVTVYTPG